MTDPSQIRTEALRLRDRFAGQGAQVVECAILQPAETLLDLYGEDIRTRAYVSNDPARGEIMLRPDFTVPVVQMHMVHGATPARYTYAGEVFRRQEENPERPSEYLQVGYEVFDGSDPAAADAEVFATLYNALADIPLRAATGDLSILSAAVSGLRTSDARKNALMRHLWRPRRFRNLLDRYAGVMPIPKTRKDLLAEPNPLVHGFEDIGLRSQSEVAVRIEALRVDAATAPISATEVELLTTLLEVRETCPVALAHLREIAVDLPSISGAVDGLRRRIDAMDERGLPLDEIGFEASYGRTTMEYYGGFVFGLTALNTPDVPALATGGRYDALCARLSLSGEGIPAVGGVLRPDILLQIRRSSA